MVGTGFFPTGKDQAYEVLGVRSVTNNIVVTGADTEEFERIDFEADPWWVDSHNVAEPVLRVDNPSGAVRVKVANTDRIRIRRSSRSRPVKPDDTRTTQLGRKTRVRAQPPDGATIDLEVDLPYGHRVEIETIDGPISLTGLVRHAEIRTSIGRVELSIPWQAVRLEASSSYRPLRVDIPPDLRTSLRSPPPETGTESATWTIQDLRDPREELYGTVSLSAKHPDALVLRRAPIPDQSPVRMHWEAPDALASMLRRPFRMQLVRPGTDGSKPDLETPSAPSDVAQFNSDVRLVQLSAAVLDSMNRPVPGLGREDFRIVEDGAEQRIGVVQDSDADFNLILLLDCSTSTLVDRSAVMEAARQFVLAARPMDHVGIYLLSGAYLHVLSRLTADREALLSTIERIPRLSGGTPLYDAITLSYAQELARRRWERNAIIVISDGMDNELQPAWSRALPSRVPFRDAWRPDGAPLARAAAAFDRRGP